MSSNSLKNGYSYTPSPDNLAATQSALGVLELQWQPDLIDLTAPERRGLRKTGPRSVGFLGDTLGFSRANAQMIPGFVDLDEFDKCLAAYATLQAQVRSIAKSSNMAEDSLMALGSKLMGMALACYAAFQAAAKLGVPGAELIVAELAEQFAKQAKADKSGTTPEDAGHGNDR